MTTINNEALVALEKAKAAYFGANITTTPISTDLADHKTIGALSTKSVNLVNEVHISLSANKKRPDMFLPYIMKSREGTFKLHCLFPMLQNNLPRQGSNAIDTVNVYVSVSAHPGKHLRNIGTQENPVEATAYADGNLGALLRLNMSNKLTVIEGFVNITMGVIPASIKYAQDMYHEKLGGKEYPIHQVIKKLTLNAWKKLQELAIAEEIDEQFETKTAAIEHTWNHYVALRDLWIEKGYLIESPIYYGRENSLNAVNAPTLGLMNTSPELNISSIIGTDYGMASFLPDTQRAFVMGVLTDSTQDTSGKFQFGVYAANARTSEDLVTLTDEEEIRTTVEQATRELMITDGAGQPVNVTIRVRDVTTGSGNRRTINKRARALHALPAGTQLLILGSKIVARYSREGTQEIRFELSDLNYVPLTTNANLIAGDFTVSEDDSTMVSFLDIEDDAFNLDNIEVLSTKPEAPVTDAKGKPVKDKAVTKSTAKTDDKL